jgi:putative ABC transport system permease protein
MLRFLPLVWKNSLRNKRRSLLTISSVAMSLCLLGVLFALYRSFFHGDETPESALRLITRHRVSLTVSLPGSYGARIRQIPGVKEVSVYSWFQGVYKDARDPNNFFARFAVQPEQALRILSEWKFTEEERKAFLSNRTAAVASDLIAKAQNWKVGDKITIKGDIYPVNLELTLVGFYRDTDKTKTLIFNDEYLQQALGVTSRRYATVGTYYILAESPEAVPRVAKAVDDMFENAPEPTKTESEKQFALSFVSFLGNVKLFLLAICGAVTFTILLVSANTMAMSVRERIREVGILKTLGFTNGEILGVILGEALMISFIGGVIGTGLAVLLCGVVRNAPTNFQQLETLRLTPDVALLCIGVAMVIGFASALIPASNASRTPILDSLRYSG